MKNLTIAIIIAIISLISNEVVNAEDVIMDIKVSSMADSVDKNGSPFKRVGFAQKASLNGIAYEKTVLMMSFSDTLSLLETVKIGDSIKVIANKSDYKGRDSYTLISVVK